jgi:hypothetical protein
MDCQHRVLPPGIFVGDLNLFIFLAVDRNAIPG